MKRNHGGTKPADIGPQFNDKDLFNGRNIVNNMSAISLSSVASTMGAATSERYLIRGWISCWIFMVCHP